MCSNTIVYLRRHALIERKDHEKTSIARTNDKVIGHVVMRYALREIATPRIDPIVRRNRYQPP